MRRSVLYLLLTASLFAVGGGVVLSRPGADTPKAVYNRGDYVALGDSVAAGLGLAVDSDASACNRTDQSYPNLLAAQLSYRLSNRACSGATVPAGLAGSQDVNQLQVPAQLDQLFKLSRPKLITLTIGANDADWTVLLGHCYSGSCGTASDEAALSASLAVAATHIDQALSRLSDHYDGQPPTVLVTGYYQAFPAHSTASCTDLTGITAAELVWGNHVQTAISQAVRSAVSKHTGMTYVPLDFSGHEFCSSDPWIQGLSDPAPYHPTAAGQKQIVRELRTALQLSHS